MTTNLPIETLTEIARTRADEAARRLAALRDADLGARHKLEVLLEFRRDYDRQLRTLMLAGVCAAQLRNYREFLKGLDDGIDRQRAAAHQAQRRLDEGRLDWQHEKVRLNAFDTLAHRMRRQELLVQNRHEQRTNDEHAARQLLTRGAPA